MTDGPPPGGPPAVDLTDEEATLPEDRALAATGDPDEVFQRTISSRQEWVRTALAVGAFLALVGIMVLLILADYAGITVENIEKVAAATVTPLTGIVGTIVGFYFAERRGGQ
jgi:hypothetical protein